MDVISVVVDGEEKNSAPARGLYKVTADCGDTTIGEWDYNAWSLVVNNLSENTRCNVNFISNGINKLEYNKLIEEGKQHRRNTYRGQVLVGTLTEEIDGETYTTTGKYTLDEIYSMISNGTFADIYVGDIIIVGDKRWLVADIDNYLHCGDQGNGLEQHHATIIPAMPLANSGMNNVNRTTGSYYNSEMVQGKQEGSTRVKYTLIDALAEVESAFGANHIIQYRNLLANEIDQNRTSAGWGVGIYTNDEENSGSEPNYFIGSSSNWGWYDRKIDLMSEANVYGINASSSSYYDTGIDNRQYAIFQLKPEYINSYGNSRFNYWLKNVSNFIYFSLVGHEGSATSYLATVSFGVRPRFLIG